MEYCYSGTESLWHGSWNRHVCRKGKCAAYRHSRSTGVNPSRKQRCCSPSCLWSQGQRDTVDPDNSQSLGYWLTIRHQCICTWSWTEMLFFFLSILRAKTVWIPLHMSTEICRLGAWHNLCPLECRLPVGKHKRILTNVFWNMSIFSSSDCKEVDMNGKWTLTELNLHHSSHLIRFSS